MRRESSCRSLGAAGTTGETENGPLIARNGTSIARRGGHPLTQSRTLVGRGVNQSPPCSAIVLHRSSRRQTKRRLQSTIDGGRAVGTVHGSTVTLCRQVAPKLHRHPDACRIIMNSTVHGSKRVAVQRRECLTPADRASGGRAWFAWDHAAAALQPVGQNVWVHPSGGAENRLRALWGAEKSPDHLGYLTQVVKRNTTVRAKRRAIYWDSIAFVLRSAQQPC